VTPELRGGRPADVLIEVAESRDVGLVVLSGGRGQHHELGVVCQPL
jgi:hypothetical protein